MDTFSLLLLLDLKVIKSSKNSIKAITSLEKMGASSFIIKEKKMAFTENLINFKGLINYYLIKHKD